LNGLGCNDNAAKSHGQYYANSNFLFTTEINVVFKYKGGEVFTFSGDDDVFVFINRKLALDLGGVHPEKQGNIILDTLNLIVGQNYARCSFSTQMMLEEDGIRFHACQALLGLTRPTPCFMASHD
jgi:fibro-slime domain-containing protein